MAKSLEDTLFYRYARLLALNEVGGDPGHFGISVESFHAANAERARDWPNAMIATATHDTKRGEDARTRLLALTALPEAWTAAVAAWREVVQPLVATVDDQPAPDETDQLILLQALIGAWPLELLAQPGDAAGLDAFRARVQAFVQKAMREAKRHSSWIKQNAPYEDAVASLVDALLQPDSAFVRAFAPLLLKAARLGMVGSLIRTVLKTTLPGLPDTYQGSEFWDFSFVDPDNRRPVDYAARARGLASASLDELRAAPDDGRVKQHVLAAILADRAADPSLYAAGDYGPMTREAGARPVIGFARTTEASRLVVAFVRPEAADLTDDGALPRPVGLTGMLPLSSGYWRNLLTGRTFESQGSIATADLFGDWHVIALRNAE